MNIQVIYRLAPCRALTSGGDSKECIWAEEIVDPVAVGSTARAEEIAAAVLHNPSSEYSAHDWRTTQLSTINNRHYKAGDTFQLNGNVGVLGLPLLYHDGQRLTQQLVVHWIS